MKKIMFNDKYHLTHSVLNGNKTQTRRIVKYNALFSNWKETLKHAPYQIGETLCVAMSYENIYYRIKDTWEYAEEYRQKKEHLAGWNNKMFVKAAFMPYRIRITNVRIERLQDISNEDCLKEGIFKVYDTNVYGIVGKNLTSWINPKDAYAYLIDKISGKGTWQNNPFVWVYDFENLKKDVFGWWISGKSYKKWYCDEYLQTKLDFEEFDL